MVPWGPLSSLVVSLTSVNGLHQWPLISRFHSCLTSRPFIHVGWNVPIQRWWIPWGKMRLYSYHLSFQVAIGVFKIWYICILWHRSTFVLGHGYDHCLVENPQCMSGGCTCHDSFVSWIHNVRFCGNDLVSCVSSGSAVYVWQLCLVIISESISARQGLFWYKIDGGCFSSSFASCSQPTVIIL